LVAWPSRYYATSQGANFVDPYIHISHMLIPILVEESVQLETFMVVQNVVNLGVLTKADILLWDNGVSLL